MWNAMSSFAGSGWEMRISSRPRSDTRGVPFLHYQRQPVVQVELVAARADVAGFLKPVHPLFTDRGVNIQSPISEHRTSGQYLPEFKPGREGFVENFLHLRVFILKYGYDLRHCHELISSHKEDQISVIRIFQVMQIV